MDARSYFRGHHESRLEDHTATALGLDKGTFTISDRVDEGVKTSYRVSTSDQRKFNCYVTGSVSVIGPVVSDAVCSEVGKTAAPAGQLNNPACNALLRAAGRC